MEDTHGDHIYCQDRAREDVLILIIMEDTHGVQGRLMLGFADGSLNPYYNGRYSWRQDKCPGLKSQCVS